MSKHFNKWCSVVGVITYKDLCDLIVLEQFRDCLPSEVATHIDERGVKTVHEAAILADEYIMARKGKLGRSRVPDVQAKNIGRSAKMSWSGSAKPNRSSGGFVDVCNYCHERGHWKADCTWLKSRFNRGGNTFPKPAALSVPIRNLPVVSNKVLEAVKTGNGNFSGFFLEYLSRMTNTPILWWLWGQRSASVWISCGKCPEISCEKGQKKNPEDFGDFSFQIIVQWL